MRRGKASGPRRPPGSDLPRLLPSPALLLVGPARAVVVFLGVGSTLGASNFNNLWCRHRGIHRLLSPPPGTPPAPLAAPPITKDDRVHPGPAGTRPRLSTFGNYAWIRNHPSPPSGAAVRRRLGGFRAEGPAAPPPPRRGCLINLGAARRHKGTLCHNSLGPMLGPLSFSLALSPIGIAPSCWMYEWSRGFRSWGQR